MEFCKAFNAKTQEMEPGAPCPTVITYLGQVLHDGHQDAAGVLLPQKSGQAEVGREDAVAKTAGSVTAKQLRDIAEAKMKDLNANDVDAAMKIILGSARSMGIEVKG